MPEFPSPRVETGLRTLDEVIENLLSGEETWRELASSIQRRRMEAERAEERGEGFESFALRRSILTGFVTNLLQLVHDLHREKIDKLIRAELDVRDFDREQAEEIGRVREQLRELYARLGTLMVALESVELGEMDPEEKYERGRMVLREMADICAEASEWFGRRVCYFDYIRPEERSFSAAANDIATILHRFAERLIRVRRRLREELGERVEERVYVQRGASRRAMDMCLTYDRAVDWMYEHDLVSPGDFGVQLCVAGRDGVKIRLGSSPGHGAHIKTNGELEYYDTDDKVNETLADVLERHAGCECIVEEDGVRCTGCDPVRASAVVALAISMDMRNEYERDRERAAELVREVMGHG